MKLKELRELALTEYQNEISSDPENTDAIFFILDEIGTNHNLTDRSFQALCESTYKHLNK